MLTELLAQLATAGPVKTKVPGSVPGDERSTYLGTSGFGLAVTFATSMNRPESNQSGFNIDDKATAISIFS